MKLVFGIFLNLIGLVSLCSMSCLVNAESRPFNVGVIIPLMGDLADYGTAIRNGFELAKQEQPDKFSGIRFVYEDSRYDGKVAVSAFQKLLARGDIDLYYLWGVSPTEATLPIAASKKVPVIAETTIKEATVGMPLVVRAARTGERIAGALAAELEKRGAKKIAFVTSEIPFYVDIRDHLEEILKERGIKVVVSKEVLPSETDFRSLLLAKDIREADYVGAFLLPAQFTAYFTQAHQANISLRSFNADILDSQAIVDACPANIEGTFFSQVGLSSEFRARYTRAFSNDSQIGSAAQSFDVAMLLSDLFNQQGTIPLSSVAIMAKIASLSPRSGATGSYSYTETRESGKEIRMPVSLKQVRNRKIETITEDSGF